MTDEICRRCNGKQQRRRRGGQCAAPKLGYEQNQKPTYYCSYLGHQNEVTFVGGISERRQTNTTHHPPTFSVKLREWASVQFENRKVSNKQQPRDMHRDTSRTSQKAKSLSCRRRYV